MKIQYLNYSLVPAVGCEDRFDIYSTTKVTVKSDKMMGKKRKDGLKIGDSYEKTEAIDFGMRLENAIHKIILYSLAANQDTTDLKGFLTAYQKQVEIVNNLLK
jgi:hypothetical protein